MAETTEIIPSEHLVRLSSAGFDRIARFITSELGIKMPDTKMSMVQSRLLRRVRELGLASVEEYGDYLFSSEHEQELINFINAVTTNKTDFFREPEHFRFLTQVALPTLCRTWGSVMKVFKVWSAACSSGEEPYTLAMVLSEFAQRQPNVDFALLGTDVSTRVLDLARHAIYPIEQISPISLDLRRKYLLQSKHSDVGVVRIVPELRRKVSFHRLNLMDAVYPVRDKFDVIFLRNVLIYFDRSTQLDVVKKLCLHLKAGGYFFVGHSESLSEMELPVERLQPSVYRMPPRPQAHGDAS